MQWKDGALAGSVRCLASQYIVMHYEGVEDACLVLYTDYETAEKAVGEARRWYRLAKGRRAM